MMLFSVFISLMVKLIFEAIEALIILIMQVVNACSK